MVKATPRAKRPKPIPAPHEELFSPIRAAVSSPNIAITIALG